MEQCTFRDQMQTAKIRHILDYPSFLRNTDQSFKSGQLLDMKQDQVITYKCKVSPADPTAFGLVLVLFSADFFPAVFVSSLIITHSFFTGNATTVVEMGVSEE